MQLNNDGLMWALVKEKPEEGLWMKRVPIPEVGPNDVKIKIHKTAICGTDVHIYQWNDWAQHTIPVGLTAGHEYVGEIVEIGEGVRGFKIGDLVSGACSLPRASTSSRFLSCCAAALRCTRLPTSPAAVYREPQPRAGRRRRRRGHP